jgi:hypothetical protein
LIETSVAEDRDRPDRSKARKLAIAFGTQPQQGYLASEGGV